MRLGQTSAIYTVSKFATSGIGFLATVYFTRKLGEEVYGFYAITIALVAWLSVIKSVGFSRAIIKRMSEGGEQDAYLTAGTIIKILLTTIVSVCVLLFQEEVNTYVGRPVAELVVVVLIVSIFSRLVTTALKGQHKVHISAPLGTLKNAARSVLMVALVFLSWELTGMLVGHALGTLVMAAVGLWIVRPSFVLPQRHHFTDLIDFAKYSWLGGMQKETFSRADILVLGLFVPAGLTGIYAVAYSLSKFLEVFGSALQNTLFPEMSKRSAEDDLSMVQTLTEDAISYAGLFLIPGVFGAAILGDRLMLIYGPGFDAGHWILTILLVGLTIYTYNRQLLNTLNAIDRPDLAFRANGAFIVSNIVLNVALVWQIGWFGAAVATTLSAVVGFVLSLRYVRMFIELPLPIDELFRQITAAALMGIVVLGLRIAAEEHLQWVAEFNVVFVVSLVGTGAVLYFATLAALSERFRAVVIRNLPL